MTSRELSALEHIERNGNLLFWDGSAMEAQRMYDKLLREKRIERNQWSGRWAVTAAGKTGESR